MQKTGKKRHQEALWLRKNLSPTLWKKEAII
jgi:hypothetical protein